MFTTFVIAVVNNQKGKYEIHKSLKYYKGTQKRSYIQNIRWISDFLGGIKEVRPKSMLLIMYSCNYSNKMFGWLYNFVKWQSKTGVWDRL